MCVRVCVVRALAAHVCAEIAANRTAALIAAGKPEEALQIAKECKVCAGPEGALRGSPC